MGIKETMTMQEALAMKQHLEQVFSIVLLLDRETRKQAGVWKNHVSVIRYGVKLTNATIAFPGRHLSRNVRKQK